jgi:hypothetical protein
MVAISARGPLGQTMRNGNSALVCPICEQRWVLSLNLRAVSQGISTEVDQSARLLGPAPDAWEVRP